MRYVSSAAAIVIALSTAGLSTAYGALNLSVTNYQSVSEQRASLTQWYLTFKADLVNPGVAIPGITATIASKAANVQVVTGQGVLHFSPVPANGRVTSADSFTLLVDRSVPFDWTQLEWSFTNPVANAGSNQTAPVTGAVTLNATASINPSGVGTLSYSWAFQSMPPGSKAALSAPNTASPTFQVDAAGTYKLKLTVSNGSGTDSAFVTVSTINSPPVAAAGPNQTVAPGATVSLNGSKSSDVDGDALTYSWSFISIPSNSAAVLFGAQSVSPTFVADARGTYKAQLIVNDGKADSQASIVTISTVNTPPVAKAGDNQTVTAGTFVQLNGAGSTDVDGDPLTYRWSFNAFPSGSAAVLSGATLVNPTFTADKTGSYIVQLIVNDGKIDSAASTVTITTNAVQAPTAQAGTDMTVHAGATVQLNGAGTDPQKFPLTYTWSLPTFPQGSTATLSATNVANPHFVADMPGIYGAQLVVSNGTLSSTPSTVTITTTDTAPEADPGKTQSVYIGDTVYLDGSKSSDADNDPITAYSWSFSAKPDTSTAVLSGATTKSPTFVADLPGAYVVQLIVSDKFASSQAKTVTINVGARTMAVTPTPLSLFNAPGTLSITLSPIPTSPVSVTLSAETAGVASFSPNPATVPANSSGVNVTVNPTAPGSTKVNANATGYFASAGTVTVTMPTISIALNDGASSVGLTYKACGNVTLDAPAPPGGTLVNLASIAAPDGAATFDSGTVSIADGGKTGAFCITGTQLGAATIQGTASGYNAGSQTVRIVMLGSVTLPSGLTVPAGQSTALNVQLTAAAPAGGVTVALASSDTSKLTISPASVLIKAGAMAPDTQPQITGAAGIAGEATVTASANGFFSDRQSIKVMGSITFKDQVASVGPGGVKSFTLLLSAPAPAGGLLIFLASSNPSVATVPEAVLVPSGQQSVEAQVSGVTVGTSHLTVSVNPSIPGNQYFSGTGADLTVTVAKPTLTITTDSLPAGTTGANYPTTVLSASGGTGIGYFWTIPVGSLPTGLTLSTGGTISGSVSGSATTSTFTVQVQDSGGNKDTKTFKITVNSQVTIDTATLPAGTAGNAYPSTTLTASGGTGTGYSWSLGSGALPTGLSLSAGGIISGTLSASATTSTFTVQVQDSATSTASKQFTITVSGGQSLAITTASLPAGTAGGSYPSTTLAASGGSGTGYTWSLTAGSLPTGLILSTAGVISGTVSSSGTTATVTIQVKDSANSTATKQFTLTVNPLLGITTASPLPIGMLGADYAGATLAASGGSGSGYTFSVIAGALPAGLTLSAAGVLSGTPSGTATTATTSSFTIQVTDGASGTATKPFTLTVYPALSITTASLPSGSPGASYPSQLLLASGGSNGGFTWSVSAGTLPTGLSLSSTGVISGTLSASATTSTFTIQVQDGLGNKATKQFTISLNGGLNITTTVLPDGTVGAAYPSTTLAATGGTGAGYVWTISAGALPAGLSLSRAGAISGTLSATATNSTFTVQVQDDAGGKTTKQFTITVTVAITTTTLPTGNPGKAYTASLTAAGGTGTGYTWSITNGSLPATLTLNSATGLISGTLSQSATSATFTVGVQDSGSGAATKQLTLTVNPALTITTGSLPDGTVGVAYPGATLAATGGSGVGYNWSLSDGALPVGLSLSVDGIISGALTSASSTATFTVQVQDSAGNIARKPFTLTVATVLSISTASLPAGALNSAYPSTTLSAGGGTGTGFVWSVSSGSLPAGLNLSAGGVISGTVSSSAVTSTFTVQVQDGGNNKATRQFTITINPALSISTASLPGGTAGAVYPSTTLAAAGGTGLGYTWSVSTNFLPSGLTLSPAGVISGTLSTLATASTFTVQVQDGAGNTATKQFTITLSPALVITTASLPDGTAGAAYPSTTLAATGGTGAGYVWSVAGGSLPEGLTLSGGGVLSGTLSSLATTSTVTIQVQDNGSNKITKELTIKVNPALIITTPSLPAAIAGTAYPSTTLAATGGTGAGYTWSVSNGTLPTGLTLTAGGVLSGTLASSATSANITVKVQDGGGNSATQAFSLSIIPALSISTASLSDGVAGSAYPATTLAATGGSGTGYTWSVTAGALPTGLSLSSGGVLSGTIASSATTAIFTVQVKDSGNNTATKQFTLTVASNLSIFTGVLPSGSAGTSYGLVTLTAIGGTGTGYAWSVSDGSLPLGLTLSAGGVLSGTLSAAAATSTFTIKVQDSAANTATRQFTLTVNAPLSIAATTLPTGVAGSTYPSTALSATGGAGGGFTWSLATGPLPAGLLLGADGVISGTLAANAATATFTVQVKDAANDTATRQFTITVNPAIQITTASLPAGTAGVAYPSTTLAATGGTSATYTWSVSIGSLPAGLSLTPAGVLSGTPTSVATTSTFTIQAQDSGGNTGRKQFTIALALNVTTSALPGGTAGAAYSGATLAAAGGTGTGYTWSLAGGLLPSGLTLSPAGAISGTLSASAATSTFTVQVQDSSSTTATKQLTITVGLALSIDTASLPTGTAGSAYPSTSLSASGGTGSGYTWTVTQGSLPLGLTLSGAGLISGTLSTSATGSTFTVQVQDSGNTTTNKQFTIAVNPQLTVTTGSLPTGIAGNAYPSTTLTASGGTSSGYTWSVSAGALPTGLSLSSGGVISGTLSSSATNATFTAKVQDSGNNIATKQLTITVNGPLTITTASPLPSGSAGNAYASTTLVASGGSNSGYTWSVTVGALPTGLSLSSGGVISGIVSSGATSATFTIQVQDSGANTASKQFTISINQLLSITTAPPLPTGVAGVAYPSTTLAASGGTGAGYTWSVSAGSLPTGLTLSAGGVISGTLSAGAATATFTAQVQDNGSNVATKQFTITVTAALSITTPSLPGGVAGSAYPTATLAAGGGTGTGYTWSVTVGALPAGLSLTPGGAISGTLSAAATDATFTVQVQDSGANTATKQFSITVSPALSITTVSMPNGIDGALYPSTTLAATGGTGSGYTWSLSAGSLPLGLILSTGGAVSGTLSSSAVTATFTIQVKDSANNIATKQFTITVTPAVSITTASLPDGVAGAAYTAPALVAAGGTGTGYTWSVAAGTLPNGLTLTPGGVISGTLFSLATSAVFTVQAQDSGGNIGIRQLTITVNQPVNITNATVPPGMQGAAYTSTTLSATGGTGTGYTWSVANGSLPANLTLSAAGVLSGTVSASALTATFTVQVKDSANNAATKIYTLTVYPALTVVTASLPGGAAGSPYSSTTLLASGGTSSGYAWTVTQGALPSGLTLSTGGLISGNLAFAAVSSTFTVQVKDSANFTATRQFTISVTAAPLTITAATSLPNAAVGQFYTTPITVAGGTQPYNWSAPPPGVPSGLSIDPNICGAGNICGTPTVAGGPFSFTITVTDSSSPTHQSTSQTFDLSVTSAGGLGSITVPNISVGVNLQAQTTITFSPPTSTPVQLSIMSGNPAAVLLGNSAESGRSPLNAVLAAGTSSFTFTIKALTTASPVTLTVTADSGYTNGNGAVTITNSGFIVAGPNGNYTDFATFGGVTSGLTLYPFRLDGNNAPVENQAIRGGLTVTAPIAVAPASLGSVNVSGVTFNGGDQNATALFTASSTNTGVASINVSPPAGFTTPTPGGSIKNVTIQQSGFVPPSGVTVGRNLQAALHISLTGAAGADTTVTVQSSDTTALKFSSDPTVIGSGTIQLVIRKGFSSTQDFYAQGYSSAGLAQYTISAPAYGTITSSMPFGPSGFVLITPGGQGSDFSVTLGGPDPSLNIGTALFDSTGKVVAFQPVAADVTLTATLTSFTPGVGTISPSSVNVLGGTGSALASFHAVTTGTTNVTATSPGYTGASVKATVTNVQIFLNPVGSVGKFLAAPSLVNANSSSSDLTVTLTSNNPALLKLAVSATDPGSTSITVTIKSGATNAPFWVFGLASSGTASYTASIGGSSSVTDTVTLAPSAVVLYMGAPGNPSCFSTGSTGCTISSAGGNATVFAITYQLTTDGTDSLNGRQPLAGSAALSVPLKNSNPAAGSAPASVSIAGGTDNTAFSFTPSATGSTVISVNNLAGWTAPAYIIGFDLTQLGITVQ